MKFELFPILDIMHELYEKPINTARFHEYLKILTSNTKNDLAVPIGGFNPMAKEHILQKINELKKLQAEKIISETLKELKTETEDENNLLIFKVTLNLLDDLKGGWTNRYTSDYDSKYKISALVSRRMCTPVFWSSEEYNEELIKKRTLESCYRSVFSLFSQKPKTLEQHIYQEIKVYEKIYSQDEEIKIDFFTLEKIYEEYKSTTHYLTIFNFLYGDAATISLGNNAKGIEEEYAGYSFAKYIAIKNNSKFAKKNSKI